VDKQFLPMSGPNIGLLNQLTILEANQKLWSRL
jgi:hypothetical protein